jgi:hypothetical protein
VEAEGALFSPLLAAGCGLVKTLAAEAFSLTLRPEEQVSIPATADFLESFSGFSNSSSLSDVLSPAWEEASPSSFRTTGFMWNDLHLRALAFF